MVAIYTQATPRVKKRLPTPLPFRSQLRSFLAFPAGAGGPRSKSASTFLEYSRTGGRRSFPIVCGQLPAIRARMFFPCASATRTVVENRNEARLTRYLIIASRRRREARAPTSAVRRTLRRLEKALERPRCVFNRAALREHQYGDGAPGAARDREMVSVIRMRPDIRDARLPGPKRSSGRRDRAGLA
jgi:hypothetical protein